MALRNSFHSKILPDTYKYLYSFPGAYKWLLQHDLRYFCAQIKFINWNIKRAGYWMAYMARIEKVIKPIHLFFKIEKK